MISSNSTGAKYNDVKKEDTIIGARIQTKLQLRKHNLKLYLETKKKNDLAEDLTITDKMLNLKDPDLKTSFSNIKEIFEYITINYNRNQNAFLHGIKVLKNECKRTDIDISSEIEENYQNFFSLYKLLDIFYNSKYPQVSYDILWITSNLFYYITNSTIKTIMLSKELIEFMEKILEKNPLTEIVVTIFNICGNAINGSSENRDIIYSSKITKFMIDKITFNNNTSLNLIVIQCILWYMAQMVRTKPEMDSQINSSFLDIFCSFINETNDFNIAKNCYFGLCYILESSYNIEVNREAIFKNAIIQNYYRRYVEKDIKYVENTIYPFMGIIGNFLFSDNQKYTIILTKLNIFTVFYDIIEEYYSKGCYNSNQMAERAIWVLNNYACDSPDCVKNLMESKVFDNLFAIAKRDNLDPIISNEILRFFNSCIYNDYPEFTLAMYKKGIIEICIKNIRMQNFEGIKLSIDILIMLISQGQLFVSNRTQAKNYFLIAYIKYGGKDIVKNLLTNKYPEEINKGLSDIDKLCECLENQI